MRLLTLALTVFDSFIGIFGFETKLKNEMGSIEMKPGLQRFSQKRKKKNQKKRREEMKNK